MELYTLGFLEADVEFLIQKFAEIGILAKKYKASWRDGITTPEMYEKGYWVLYIGGIRNGNLQKAIDYVRQGDHRLLKIIDEKFPHKIQRFTKKNS